MTSVLLARSLLPLAMTCSLAVSLPAADPPAADRLLQLQRPVVIAHRGYNVLAPENTLPAFHTAKETGADLIELDYHHSKEGTPIVIHDATLDRTTDATNHWQGPKIPISSRSVPELKSLDAGTWFSPKFAGTRLPLLTEALDLIQKGNVTLIERKAGDAATCAQLLRDRNLINQVVVQSFDWDYLRDFHRLAPEQILGALGPPGSKNGRKLTDEEKVLTPDWIAALRPTGAKLVVWNKQVTRDAIAHAHGLGLKVWIYTINDPAVATDLLDLGVDGIITDNPSLVWRAMALRSYGRVQP